MKPAFVVLAGLSIERPVKVKVGGAVVDAVAVATNLNAAAWRGRSAPAWWCACG